jgi:type VI protein secretion system component VasK
VQPATSSSAQPLRYPGNWGLFRFVDAGKPQKQAGGEYLLTYSVGGHPLTATIRPSGGDLFDKNIFRSLKAPQNILK